MPIVGLRRTFADVNVQPYIVEQGIAARHADLVREAEAGRLAATVSKRGRLSHLRFRSLGGRKARVRVRATLEPET